MAAQVAFPSKMIRLLIPVQVIKSKIQAIDTLHPSSLKCRLVPGALPSTFL